MPPISTAMSPELEVLGERVLESLNLNPLPSPLEFGAQDSPSDRQYRPARRGPPQVGLPQGKALRTEVWSVREVELIEEAVWVTLHYRDRHLSSRDGRVMEVEVCHCRGFDPAGEPYLRTLHAEVYAALGTGRLPELLRNLRALSRDPRLPDEHEPKEVVAAF